MGGWKRVERVDGIKWKGWMEAGGRERMEADGRGCFEAGGRGRMEAGGKC